MASAETSPGWKAQFAPASYNQDNTIQLIQGRVQLLPLILQAEKKAQVRGQRHDLTIELDLPPGMTCLESRRWGHAWTPASRPAPTASGRHRIRYQIRIDDAPPRQNFFVAAPKSIDVEQAYIGLTLREEGASQSWRWPVKLSKLTPPAKRPSRAMIGFWDYNFRMAQEQRTRDGIASFLSDVGVGFLQSVPDASFGDLLKTHRILGGQYAGGSSFYIPAAKDADAAGKEFPDDFPCPQGILDLPKQAEIPGVKTLVQKAGTSGGVVSLDYEPTGLRGFGTRAIEQFKKTRGVSDADFKTFRDYIAKRGLRNLVATFQSADPIIARVWTQWTAFRSAQVSAYMERLHRAFKARSPNGRLAVTCRYSHGADSPGTLAIGCDNSALAAGVDIIMPEFYYGYDGPHAKLAMQMTAAWRQSLQQRRAKAALWPMLFVRVAGDAHANSPKLLREQIIGTLAFGADSVMIYQPWLMDAPYWQMLARTSEDIAACEDFYLEGKHVEERFPLQGMPGGSVQASEWPGVVHTVENPSWAFTAHQLNGQVLLTLFNLQETGDLLFHFANAPGKVLQTRGAAAAGSNQWRVAPHEVGFIVLQS
jgi:hypothetical protein